MVRRIPRGRVATYGQVARVAGLPRGARLVGWALHALPDAGSIPWQRVINARGEVSPRARAGWEVVQRQLLEREGIEFDARGRVDLGRFRWRIRTASGAGRKRLDSAQRKRGRTRGAVDPARPRRP